MGVIAKLAAALRRIEASDRVRNDSAAAGAALLTKLAQASLEGHKCTGFAQSVTQASAQGDAITIRWPYYIGFVKGVELAHNQYKPIPPEWVAKVRRLHGRRIRAELKKG